MQYSSTARLASLAPLATARLAGESVKKVVTIAAAPPRTCVVTLLTSQAGLARSARSGRLAGASLIDAITIACSHMKMTLSLGVHASEVLRIPHLLVLVVLLTVALSVHACPPSKNPKTQKKTYLLTLFLHCLVPLAPWLSGRRYLKK